MRICVGIIQLKQAQDNYDLISEKLSVYNSLLMNI